MSELYFVNSVYRDASISSEPGAVVLTALSLQDGKLQSVDIRYPVKNVTKISNQLDNIISQSNMRNGLVELTKKNRKAYDILVDFKKRTGRLSPTYTIDGRFATDSSTENGKRSIINISPVQGRSSLILNRFMEEAGYTPVLSDDNMREIAKYLTPDQLNIINLAVKETVPNVMGNVFIHRVLYNAVDRYNKSSDKYIKVEAMEMIKYAISIIAEFEPPLKIWELASEMDSEIFNLLYLHYGGHEVRNIDHFSNIKWDAHVARGIKIPIHYGTETKIYSAEYEAKVSKLLTTGIFTPEKGYDLEGAANNLLECHYTFLGGVIASGKVLNIPYTSKLTVKRYLEIYDKDSLLHITGKFLNEKYITEYRTAEGNYKKLPLTAIVQWKNNPPVADNDIMFVSALLHQDVEWLVKFGQLSSRNAFLCELFCSELLVVSDEYSIEEVLQSNLSTLGDLFTDGRFHYNKVAIDRVTAFINANFDKYNPLILANFFYNIPMAITLISEVVSNDYLLSMVSLSGYYDRSSNYEVPLFHEKFIDESYTINKGFLQKMYTLINKVSQHTDNKIKEKLPYHVMTQLI